MIITENSSQITFDKNSIITLGTFDGVHLGHNQLIKKLIEIGDAENLKKILITMHPHPQSVINKVGKPHIKLLTTLKERINLLKRFDLDVIYILDFTPAVAEMTAEEFIMEFLYSKIGFSKIMIGHDHSFGKNREGNKALLDNLSKLHNFEVIQYSAFSMDKTIISSSKIRTLLSTNAIEQANELLGYSYNITGKVFHGDNRGEKIGFPTANISKEFDDKLLPGNGVYFVDSIIDNKLYYGMANIGVRPTVTDSNQIRIEVHYFGINRHLYDEVITVNFHKFIREERKFNGLDELIAQLNSDKKECEQLIKEIKDK